MAAITSALVDTQITALNQLIAQTSLQVQGLQKSLNDQTASLQAQVAQAQNNLGNLQAQLPTLQQLKAALALIDSVTSSAFQWTQDPQTQAWTGMPVQYPGTVGSHIAVYGGTGPAPVLQTLVGP